MIHLTQIDTPDQKTEICTAVLRSLPDWFGIEEALLEYTQNVRPLPFWAAMDADAPVGFAALQQHNANMAEILVMGIREANHRQGIGRQLVSRCAEYSRERGLRFLTVKTLDESAHSEHYDRTRTFYLSMGFLPFELFPTLWGPENPCLLLIMPLS